MKHDGGFGETTWGDGNSAKNLQLNPSIASTWPSLGLTRRGGRLKGWNAMSFNLDVENMQVNSVSGEGGLAWDEPEEAVGWTHFGVGACCPGWRGRSSFRETTF